LAGVSFCSCFEEESPITIGDLSLSSICGIVQQTNLFSPPGGCWLMIPTLKLIFNLFFELLLLLSGE
jgi:hypothetical protein